MQLLIGHGQVPTIMPEASIIPIDRIPTLLVQLLPFHEDRLIAGVTP